jgi:hypothetical protein
MIFPAIMLSVLARNRGMNVWVWGVIGLIPVVNSGGFVSLISKPTEFERAHFYPSNHHLLRFLGKFISGVSAFLLAFTVPVYVVASFKGPLQPIKPEFGILLLSVALGQVCVAIANLADRAVRAGG